MTRRSIIALLTVVLVAAVVTSMAVAATRGSGTPSAGTSPAPGLASPSPSPTLAAAAVLPNPALTPGVASADVTPADLSSTICVTGYTSGRRHDDGRTVRPPESYTEALKKRQIAQYRYADANPADYEEDHLIPLELGGDGYAAANLWPEPYAGTGALVKDQLENRLRVLVCDGTLDLRVAQQAIATNWYAAYERYVAA